MEDRKEIKVEKKKKRDSSHRKNICDKKTGRDMVKKRRLEVKVSRKGAEVRISAGIPGSKPPLFRDDTVTRVRKGHNSNTAAKTSASGEVCVCQHTFFFFLSSIKFNCSGEQGCQETGGWP